MNKRYSQASFLVVFLMEMKRYVPVWVLAMVATSSSVWAQELNEAKTATRVTSEDTTPEISAAPAKKAPLEFGGDGDLSLSKYDELDHVLVLEGLEGQSDEIQRKIAALKNRVDLLRESVIVGSITPSRTLIVHKNELGDSFRIESFEYKVDGESVYSKSFKDGAINALNEFEVLDGVLTPGEHSSSTRLQIKGTGHGYYSYFKGYRFQLSSKYRFNVAEGRLTKLTVVVYPRSDLMLKLKERLAIKYNLDILVNNVE